MRKFKASDKLLKQELLNLGYTDCITYRQNGLNIIAVKDGLIKRAYSRGYLLYIDTQEKFDAFIKATDELLKQ